MNEKDILIARGFKPHQIKNYGGVYATPYINEVSYYVYKQGSVYVVGRRNRKTRENTILEEVAV